MSSGSIEERLAQLEKKVQRLETAGQPSTDTIPWWDRIAGAFKDDLVYAAAMKLGAEIRLSDRSEGLAE